jgi:DNA-binding CsgD family transcriptional regulator
MSAEIAPDSASADALCLAIAEKRSGPYFYIVDGHLRVQSSRVQNPGDWTPKELPGDVAGTAAILLSDPALAANGSAVSLVRPGVVLRAVRLESELGTRFGLFIERYQQRDLIQAATQRYDLTSRETEVLDQLFLGEPTSSIAARLSIADTTVQQHVKNIGAKVGVTTRKAIVAAVLRTF